MTVTWAQLTLLGWFFLLAATLMVGGLHILKARRSGILPAALMILGALLTGAFVSAIIGLYELSGYVRTARFAASIAVGCCGLALLTTGLCRLTRQWRAKPAASPSSARSNPLPDPR
jgi:uncharacterized membrane protein